MSSVEDQPLWTPLRVGHVSERVAERILGLIAAERLHPGDRLPSERTLAASLGVGRPSLREALKVLQARGHVEIRHGTGTFVTQPSSARDLGAALARADTSFAELFAMREVVEGPAAEWAATRQDRDDLERVRGAYEALREAAEAAPVDFERLQALDASFHLRIAEAAGNRFLTRTAGVLHETLMRGMETTLKLPGRLARSSEEHGRILEAILAGDGPGAAQAARRHVNSARGAALARAQDRSGTAEPHATKAAV